MIKITFKQIIENAIQNLKEIKNEKSILGFPQHGLVPEELIHAAGFFPLRLTLAGREEQEVGDEYLSPTTCPFGRSSIGFFEKDHELYSKIDYLLTGTFCNGVQNIGNYAKYFNLPVIPFITPHTATQTSFKFYLSEIYKLKQELEHINGKKINDNDIRNSIKLYNNARKILRNIDSIKMKNPSYIHGYELFYLIHELILMGPEKMMDKLYKFMEGLKDRRKIEKKGRVLLTGTGICLGDNLYEFIELECGGLIVGDDLWSGLDYYKVDVNLEGDPIVNLTKKYLYNNMCGRMIPDPRINYIFDLFDNYKAKGIIYHILKFCDSYSGLKYEFKNSIQRRNIPILELERDYAETNTGQIKTRIEAFLEMI
ncbi:MAG: hypothetical protein GF329_01625 [Candidatus Lokiarchaeota archaeon]|nr:hypothetical protein [Candidatus Lokiarchaeota archaeon]